MSNPLRRAVWVPTLVEPQGWKDLGVGDGEKWRMGRENGVHDDKEEEEERKLVGERGVFLLPEIQ